MSVKQLPPEPRTAQEARAGGFLARIKRAGQVTVELLLVLPVFMLLLFCIMEIGNLGFQLILAHHCTYELARIGSLIAGPNGTGSGGGLSLANAKMKNAVQKMLPSAQVSGSLVMTGYDQQAKVPTKDIKVTLTYPARLIFPGSSFILEDAPKGSRKRTLTVEMRMPVEW